MLEFLKKQVKKHFSVIIYRKALSAAACAALDSFLGRLGPEQPMPLHRASFDLFTYHGEDGIIAWLTRRACSISSRPLASSSAFTSALSVPRAMLA